MRPLRRLLAGLEPAVYAASPACTGAAVIQPAAQPAAAAAAAGQADQAAADAAAGVLGPVTAEDLAAALSVTKPSAQGFEQQYADFSSRFGQTAG